VRHEHKCSCIRGIAVCRTNRVEAFSGAAGARALKKIGLERGATPSTAPFGAHARSLTQIRPPFSNVSLSLRAVCRPPASAVRVHRRHSRLPLIRATARID
jgi:hypothetical protein